MFRHHLAPALLAFTGALGGTAWAAPAVTPEPTPQELEVQVWTADEQELPLLELAVTHEIQRDAHSVQAHQLLSHLLVRQFTKDPSDLYLLRQAADLAQQALDLEPKNPRGYAALADILDLMGNPERGLQLLHDAEAQGIAANWRFAFGRARLLADKAQSSQVLAELGRALQLPGSEPRIVVPYIIALLQAEATGADLTAKLRNWNERFPSPLFELSLALALTDLGKVQEAHDLYKHVLATAPDNQEAQINDATLLYRDLHQAAAAVALLEKVLATHAHTLSSETKSLVDAHLGAAYLQLKNLARARSSFLRSLTSAPGQLGLIDFMTRAYRGAKEPKQLVLVLTQLNDQVQGTGVLHALLGETLSEQLGRHDEAVAAFADALILEPERGDYYNGMGLALYRSKAFDSALKAFQLATEVDPNDATARYNEACVLAVTGHGDEALAILTEAIGIDPRLMATAQADVDFAALQSSQRFQNLVQGATPEPGKTAVAH